MAFNEFLNLYKELKSTEFGSSFACLFQLLQYISDSGGVLGLWFGFAIMTFIEFLEFFVDCFVLTVNKISTRLH